ncbi:DNA internalization-related competence protein ComEC/Rec2 [Enterococcus pseudoavium]|uniref:DNA internalization-related competence protein ComEC/Rec2 n=1 Tax=Enterococcus pseudoavium TaxID=44007 RepID=UPI003F9A9D0E
MKKRQLLLLVILCSFFLAIRTYFYISQLIAEPVKLTEEVLTIETDSVKVDGNLLKLTGEIHGKKYLVYYALKNPREKKYWISNDLTNIAVVSGESENFETARNLNGFDEQKYYHSLGISQKLQVKTLKPMPRKSARLSDLRKQLIWRIDQSYDQRLASYVKALVIGYKDSHFAEQTKAYKSTGLLHLFTLSGLHIQFYLGGVHLLLKRCRLVRESRLILLSGLGLLLIGLTGSSFSTIRAVLSYLIAFTCVTFDCMLAKLDQWSIMLFFLVLCFPLVLWSVGAQLSLYFALLLLYMTDLRLKTWQQMLLFSFLSMPLLLYSFSEWTFIGGLVTLLLFPLFEWVILPGCLLLFIGCFLPFTQVLSRLMDGLFQLLEIVLVGIAFPNLTIGRPSLILLMLLILLVLLMIDRLKYRQKVCLLAGAMSFCLIMLSFSPKGLVTFVDVGQGDCIFIRLPFKRETFLIDTGGCLNFKRQKWQRQQQRHLSDYNLLPFLKSIGCSKIDHLLITHNDADHMGELTHVLNEIKVKNLYFAKGSQQALKRNLESVTGTRIHLVQRGDTVGKYLKLQILSPEISRGENNDSLVTFFIVNRQRFLLTGDLEVEGEEKLISAYPQLRTDFLKVGHHGSNTSTGEALLKKMQPKYGIISVGKNNRYGHPTVETLRKLKKYRVTVFRTDQQGMIYYQWWPLINQSKIEVMIDFLE